ncbi:TRAP transporter substrate-binding protein [Sulfitobacter sp. PR48]|uniref:TRAP transporter substrate-binding protein n=1 Tax=Sulfitobacter sp. PR48 TaxID=3028383 RepID=UPI00237AD619|nr:TRAP transporter substrate-binding protein [Sulfitobacter sp. PR48]MDD9721066.1 TRAP transporter substrate-binding protein [Sulfitobacter sp. PR48]
MKLRDFLIATVTTFAFGTTATAEILRFSSFEPPVAHVTKNILTPWAEKVNAASEGTLDIQMFPGGTLGRNPAQQLKLVEDGVADIAWVIPGYTPGRFDQGTIGELPFLVPNGTVGSEAMWSVYEQGLLTGDYEKFKLIGVMTSFPNAVASTVEVRTPADMKGLNFRAPGPTMLGAINALGAVPVGGITGPGLAEAISRGLIAGTFTQYGAIETFRVGETVSYYLDMPLGATPMLIVMNQAKFDSLPDKAKAAIDQYSGKVFSEEFGKSFDQYVGEARERVLAANDITEIEPDEALTQQWKDALSVSTTEWIAGHENGQALYDAFVAAIDKASAAN